MKSSKIILGLFILIILNVLPAYAQKQFTHTVTAKNKYCNATCSIIDVPGLNDNPGAILLVTPSAENGGKSNSHPVGVFYVPSLKKWSITTTDGTAITEGAKFNVKPYPTPDSNQFVYVVPPRGTVPCLDHPSLNANPNAQIGFSPTGSPRGAYFNPDEIQIVYDASALKWCLENVNNKLLPSDTAYNIVINRSITVLSNAPLPPVIVIVRTEWTIPSQSGVALGDCTVIKGGYTNPAILITDSVIVTGHQYGQGANLRWTAEAGNGSIVITVCNNGNSGSSPSAQLNGKKMNILVLR